LLKIKINQENIVNRRTRRSH